jgi:hypothetical protein
MSRGGWPSLLLGLAIGVAAGLYYAWSINPVEYQDTGPASLRQDFKQEYVALIAAAYAEGNDLARARGRLALFPDLDLSSKDLEALAQQRLAAGAPAEEALALARLAEDLQPADSAAASPPSSSGARPTRTATPSATPRPLPSSTPRPTLAPSATPGAPFTLVSRQELCDATRQEAFIRVTVLDAAGEQVPGVAILVIWDEGQDRFFTGLKPELGAGFADFSMDPETTYALQLEGADQLVTDLEPIRCQDDEGQSYSGSWDLRFQQP